jgi:hypothetical protein
MRSRSANHSAVLFGTNETVSQNSNCSFTPYRNLEKRHSVALLQTLAHFYVLKGYRPTNYVTLERSHSTHRQTLPLRLYLHTKMKLPASSCYRVPDVFQTPLLRATR